MLTDTLKLSIYTEIIKNFVESNYDRFYGDPESFTEKELENLERACRLVGKTGYAVAIDHQLEKLA